MIEGNADGLGREGEARASAQSSVRPSPQAPTPVWVADHPRAIADLAFDDHRRREATGDHDAPGVVTARIVNAWLDTEDQVDVLARAYLRPLSALFEGTARRRWADWVGTVRFA